MHGKCILSWEKDAIPIQEESESSQHAELREGCYSHSGGERVLSTYRTERRMLFPFRRRASPVNILNWEKDAIPIQEESESCQHTELREGCHSHSGGERILQHTELREGCHSYSGGERFLPTSKSCSHPPLVEASLEHFVTRVLLCQFSGWPLHCCLLNSKLRTRFLKRCLRHLKYTRSSVNRPISQCICT